MIDIRTRLQAQLAQAILTGFETLGGDPVDAVIAARKHETVEDWINQETTMIAIAGGAGMVIPALGGLTLAAGMAYLLHKLAVICWGIGALKGAYVVENPQFSDLLNILTVWMAGKEQAAQVERLALGMDAFLYAVTVEGAAALNTAVTDIRPQTPAHHANALYALLTLAARYPVDERAQRLVAALTDADTAKAALSAAQSRSVTTVDVLHQATGDRLLYALGGKINQETAMQIALALLADVPLRFVMSLLPGVGAILNAILNAQVMRAVADAATAYYDRRLQSSAFQLEV